MAFSFASKSFVFILTILSWFALNGQTSDGVSIVQNNVGPFAQANGNQKIYGAIENFSINIVSSLDIAWRVNNGDVHVDTYSNLNIGNWTKFIFEHKTHWQIGNDDSYFFKLWIERINGEIAENIDTLIIPVKVLNQTAKRSVLIESFSSIDCASCASVNPAIREISEKFKDNTFTIAYQIDCYSDNPMCLFAENDIFSRVDLYGIQSTPNILINNWYRGNSAESIDQYIAAELERPSPIDISGSFRVVSDRVEVECKLSPFYPIASEKLVAKLAFTQDIVSFDSPPGGNGEATFFHILRRFSSIPTNTLNPISQGENVTINIDEDFEGIDIDFEKLRVAFFIQDTSTYEIIQMNELSPIQTGAEIVESASIKVYPNPTTSSIFVSIDEPKTEKSTVRLLDQLGRVVYENDFGGHNNLFEIPTKGFSPGFYLVWIIGENIDSKKRVIIN